MTFLFTVQVILLNGFLLALLNDVYSTTNDKAVEMQIMDKVKLIRDYQNKPILPPPFSQFEVVLRSLVDYLQPKPQVSAEATDRSRTMAIMRWKVAGQAAAVEGTVRGAMNADGSRAPPRRNLIQAIIRAAREKEAAERAAAE